MKPYYQDTTIQLWHGANLDVLPHLTDGSVDCVCILAGCKPGGTVLDPFHGSGTTGMVAQRLGRKYVGIELNRDYIDLSLKTRLADGTLDFEGTA